MPQLDLYDGPFIEANYTFYSMEDFERCIRALRDVLAGRVPDLLPPEWENQYELNRRGSLGAKLTKVVGESSFPLVIGDWTNPVSSDRKGKTKDLVLEPWKLHTLGGSDYSPQGPFFFAPYSRPCPPNTARVRVLPYDKVVAYLNPTVALARLAQDSCPLLPNGATQFLLSITRLLGVSFREATRLYSRDERSMYWLILAVVRRFDLSIRVMPNRQDKRPRSSETPKERAEKLLTTGSLMRALQCKSDSLESIARRYHAEWVKAYQQWERESKKTGACVPPPPTVGEAMESIRLRIEKRGQKDILPNLKK